MGAWVPDAHPAVERFLGERLAGRFLVERLTRVGELSSTFRAHDELLRRRVSVKLFHPVHRDEVATIDGQLETAQAVARLDHPSIARVIDRGEHAGMPFLVLEHVRGETLAERIDHYAPLAIDEVVALAAQLARALAHAHAHGVMHGNIRPESVLVSEDETIKLIDFGRSSYLHELRGDPYSAPEQSAYDADEPTPAGDIFALAAVLACCLLGEPVAADVDPADLQIMRPDAPSRLTNALARALSENPDLRQHSMREFIAAIGTRSLRRDGNAADGATRRRETNGAHIVTEPYASIAPRARDQRRARAARPPARRKQVAERGYHSLVARVAIIAGPVLLLIVVAWTVAGGRQEHGHVSKAKQVPLPTALAPVALKSAVSYDPFGDHTENQATAANAIDDDPTTSWETQGYGSPQLGGLKKGVGLVVQLDAAHKVGGIRIVTSLQGWRVQVFAAKQPQHSFSAWTPVSEPTAVLSGHRIQVQTHGVAYASYLLWIDRLALDPADATYYRARISDVRVLAPDVSNAP